MIAYTAWDSLRVIAREYDADLTHDMGGALVMAPRWQRCPALIAFRRLTLQLRDGLSSLCAAPASDA